MCCCTIFLERLNEWVMGKASFVGISLGSWAEGACLVLVWGDSWRQRVELPPEVLSSSPDWGPAVRWHRLRSTPLSQNDNPVAA